MKEEPEVKTEVCVTNMNEPTYEVSQRKESTANCHTEFKTEVKEESSYQPEIKSEAPDLEFDTSYYNDSIKLELLHEEVELKTEIISNHMTTEVEEKRFRNISMASTRGRKILEVLPNLYLPKYDSTKGTEEDEKTQAILRGNEVYPKNTTRLQGNYDSCSEDKSPRSQDIPSDCSSDDDCNVGPSKPKKLLVFNEVDHMEMENMWEAVPLNNTEKTSNTASNNRVPVKRTAPILATAGSSINLTPTISSDLLNKVDAKTVGVRIQAATKTDKGKRIRDKWHSCYYCQAEIINVARHLEVKHGEELDIARLLAMPKKSQGRKEGFTEIVRAGDFYHNCNVTSVREGELILVRRPTANEIKCVTYNDYGPCPNCLGFMLKKHMWLHVKKLCKKAENLEAHSNRHIIAESNAILSNVFGTEFTADYRTNIINSFRGDKIGNYCKEDLLLLKFGGMMFEKYGVTQCELIRQLMRQMARLVITINELSLCKLTLSDLLVPEKFDIVVQGTKKLCGSDSTKRPEFDIPSLALKIGHSLKKCASIERGLAVRNRDLKKNETLMSFISLLELQWQRRISSHALATLYKRKENTTLKDTQIEDLPPVEEDDDESEREDPDESNKRETLIYNPDVEDVEAEANEIATVTNNLQRTRRPWRNNKSASTRRQAIAVVKNSWAAEDKKFVFDFFKVQIKNGVVPGKQQCEMCQSKHPSLLNRKWTDLKFCVKNQITKVARMKLKL